MSLGWLKEHKWGRPTSWVDVLAPVFHVNNSDPPRISAFLFPKGELWKTCPQDSSAGQITLSEGKHGMSPAVIAVKCGVGKVSTVNGATLSCPVAAVLVVGTARSQQADW